MLHAFKAFLRSDSPEAVHEMAFFPGRSPTRVVATATARYIDAVLRNMENSSVRGVRYSVPSRKSYLTLRARDAQSSGSRVVTLAHDAMRLAMLAWSTLRVEL